MTGRSAGAGQGGEPWRLVPALGIAQIISWGALYYAIGVLAGAIGADLGLGPGHVFGGYSTGLLLSAAAAPMVGRAIDRHGGRLVLAAGSVVAGLALLGLATAQSVVGYYAAWCVAGVAMALTLYDTAFATLAQNFGVTYRRALTLLTLFGGFASTVFWPLAQFGLARIGWRDTLLAFAGLEFLVCLPLHWWLVPPGRGRVPMEAVSAGIDSPVRSAALTAAAMSTAKPPPGRRSRVSGEFVSLAVALSLNAFVTAAVAAHLIGLLQAKGMAANEVVWIAALIGPMQVAGRVMEITLGRGLRPITVGVLALSLLIGALVLLLIGSGLGPAAVLVFAVTYGISNGVMTIVRGTVPAELFGRVDYGSLLGRLAAPSHVARAVGPVALAALAMPATTPDGALSALLVLAILSLVAFLVTVRLSRRPFLR